MSTTRVVAGHPGSTEIADQLIDLYLSGKKLAGSSLLEDYLTAGEPLPQAGDHWIALASNGDPRCILRTERVEIHAFLEVPERVAQAEGEGDLSLKYWRDVHTQHYAPYLREWGLADIEEAGVVTEFFSLVFPGKSKK